MILIWRTVAIRTTCILKGDDKLYPEISSDKALVLQNLWDIAKLA